MTKAEISYPCTWSFKIIASEMASVVRWIEGSLREGDFELLESNRSRSGKYVSVELSVRVECQQQRDEIFRCLQALAGVKMVL